MTTRPTPTQLLFPNLTNELLAQTDRLPEMTRSLLLRTISWIPSNESPVPPLDLYQISKAKLTQGVVNKKWKNKLSVIVGLYENPSIHLSKADAFLKLIRICEKLKRFYFKGMKARVRQLLATRDMSEEERIAAEVLAMFNFR